MAERLVAANGLASTGGGPITIVQGRLEQLPSLPVEQVCSFISFHLRPYSLGCGASQSAQLLSASQVEVRSIGLTIGLMKACLLALHVGLCVSLSGSLSVCAKSGMLMQVDVIVSEWMGYALLFESMLDTVLYARDRSASLLLPI